MMVAWELNGIIFWSLEGVGKHLGSLYLMIPYNYEMADEVDESAITSNDPQSLWTV
jgi:hypothetical protein